MVENKTVYCQLLQADQYGRAVAQVRFGALPFWQSIVDEKMLKDGLAEVYLGSEAVYGRNGEGGVLGYDGEGQTEQDRNVVTRRCDKRESAAEIRSCWCLRPNQG
jgi:endonuclease YncB( thermonuclease family)